MRPSTVKTLAAVVLTGVGSALVVGFRTPPDAFVATSGVPAVPGVTTSGSSSAAGGSSVSAGGSSASSGGSSSAAGGSTASSGTSSGSAPSATGSAGPGARTLADGTYAGSAVGEPWGEFQVQVTVSGGKIAAISVLQSPQDRHSSRINSQAVPMLTQAVIAAQSTSVDMVSGATWTSESYLTSLQAALDQAKASAQTAG